MSESITHVTRENTFQKLLIIPLTCMEAARIRCKIFLQFMFAAAGISEQPWSRNTFPQAHFNRFILCSNGVVRKLLCKILRHKWKRRVWISKSYNSLTRFNCCKRLIFPLTHNLLEWVPPPLPPYGPCKRSRIAICGTVTHKAFFFPSSIVDSTRT